MNPVPSGLVARPTQAPATRRIEVVDQSLLRLRRWPSLARLPAGIDVGLAARICALLGRKPTVGFLVARLLDVPHSHAGPVLAKLYADGYIEVTRAVTAATGDAPAAATPYSTALPDSRFIAKLWRFFTR